LTPEPHVRSQPCLWRYEDVRPRVLRAGELVTAEEAERRVLMLLNPGLEGKMAATATLYAGIQLILPGEVARTHHHTPAAIRFVIEGEGGYTAVSGEKAPMHRGDYLTTPNWAWHDHGNDGVEPVIWLDGLDLPFVTGIDAVFFEEFGEDRQPIVRPQDDSLRRWGANLKPSWQAPPGPYSPILNYSWATSRAALHGLRESEGSPFDGIIMEYINPVNGGPTLPTMSAYLQLLRRGEHTRAHRHVASTVYHVAEGGGFSVIAGRRFAWAVGDTFVVPAWAWHEHAALDGEAVLFSFSDRPILQAFALDREEALAAGRQV
jgi:gentisate 1,2-dioxygenase